MQSLAVAGVPPQVDDAQNSVEFLCHRFSVLFTQLHKEEAERKAAEVRNDQLEQRLAELRLKESQQASIGRAEVDGKLTEAAALRREVETAEQRAALGGNEADALANAVATYSRQAERLRERYKEEAAQEQSAGITLRKRTEELQDLRDQHAELFTEMESAESGRARLADELRQVTQGTTQMCKDISALETRLQDEKRRSDSSEGTVRRQREELVLLDNKLNRAHKDLAELTSRLEGERSECRMYEEKLSQHGEQKMRCEEEVSVLSVQLAERRREGSDYQLKLGDQTREIKKLREQLQVEQQFQSQEQQAAEAAHVKLQQLRSEMPTAESTLLESNTELAQLRKHTSDLEDRCSAQRAWQEELRQKHSMSEVALERLREELRILTSDRARMQQEVDKVLHDRTRLEVELEMTQPALHDMRRRCRDLEDHLSSRVRELGDEVEKARRFRTEANSARAKLQNLERHTDTLSAKLQDIRSIDREIEHRSVERGGEHLGHPGSALRGERRAHFAQGIGHPGEPIASSGRDHWESRHATPNSLPPNLALGGPGTSPSRVFKPHEAPFREIPDSYKDQGLLGSGQPGGYPPKREDPDRDRDAVRFLCEFVAREEERLGLTPRSSFLTPNVSGTPTNVRRHGLH